MVLGVIQQTGFQNVDCFIIIFSNFSSSPLNFEGERNKLFDTFFEESRNHTLS